MTWAMRLNEGQLIDDGKGVHYDGVDGDGWTVNVLRDGTTLGNPETLTQTLNTLMTQGAWEVTDPKRGNRPPALGIKITGDTADGLNAGEVWLSALMVPGALEWLPPGQTVWTVFDLTSCYIDRAYDERWDLDEHQWIRRYRIPIRALPYARSPELTVTPAAPVTSSVVDVQINDGSSATDWTGSWGETYPYSSGGSITPTVVSGRVRVTRTVPANRGPNLLRARYAIGSAIPGATPFLQVDFRAFRSSGNLTRILAEDSTGFVRTVFIGQGTVSTVSANLVSGTAYFFLPDDTVAVTVETSIPENTSSAYLEVDQLRRLSRLPDSGTGRQTISVIRPGGSAPADGTLHVSHSANGLGKVMLYTYPVGRPSPDIMQYRTSSTTPVSDASSGQVTLSGQLVPIQSADLVLTIPDVQLPVRGQAALWAKVSVTSDIAATITVTVTPTVGGQAVGPVQTLEYFAGATVLFEGLIVPLGIVSLPGTETGTDGAVVVTLRRTAGPANVSIDKVWALGMDDDCALSLFDAGSGFPAASGFGSNHAWVVAPSADKPAGEIRVGTGPGDARWPAVVDSHQIHKLPPEGVSVLTVATHTGPPSTDFQHYKRWTHHAAETS